MTDYLEETQEQGEMDFEEGRYLYCVVSANEGATFSADGIEGGSVSLLVEDGIGAVVQPVDSLFDSEDVTRVRKWLLSHQRVVDAAGEAFGTPLPFRFDTVFTGGDEVVSEWLRDTHHELQEALDWLAGRWEYRIEIRWDEGVISERLREEDDELRALTERMDDASSGTGYLLESQYEQRLTERLQDRSRELEAELIADIEPYAVEIEHSGGQSGIISTEQDPELETAVQLSILADSSNEEMIGEILETYAQRPAYEVRYTGAWPPYSHAPEIGGEKA